MSDYSPAAAAAAAAAAVPLTLSPASSRSSSPVPPPPLPRSPSPTPAWLGGGSGGGGGGSSSSSSRAYGTSGRHNRLGRRYSLGRPSLRDGGHGGAGGRARRAVASVARAGGAAARRARASAERAAAYFVRLPPLQRVLVAAAVALGAAASVVMLVFLPRFLAWVLGPVAHRWRTQRGGWVLVWLVVFVSAFPPLIGYSTASTMAGVVYGFPGGWPLAATASVAGSLAAFLASRTVLSGWVDRWVGHDARFKALGQVLRRDGLWVLAAVRLCPLPYSLSNGFLATIPSISPLAFALSTAMASPKLLVHVFAGSRLALLADDDESKRMTGGEKALNYISMFTFGLIGIAVGLLVYRRTMARAAEIAREEGDGDGDAAADTTASAGVHAAEEGRARPDPSIDPYADDEHAHLIDPDDADVAAIMDDDDISLWAVDHFADGDGGGDDDAHLHSAKPYRDESDVEDNTARKR